MFPDSRNFKTYNSAVLVMFEVCLSAACQSFLLTHPAHAHLTSTHTKSHTSMQFKGFQFTFISHLSEENTD